MNDFPSDPETASVASSEAPAPAWALVEIFGHRQHWGEIRDVEIAGGKLLEVRDARRRRDEHERARRFEDAKRGETTNG